MTMAPQTRSRMRGPSTAGWAGTVLALLLVAAWSPAARAQTPADGVATDGAAAGAAIPQDGNRRCLFCHAREDFKDKVRADGRKGLFVDTEVFQASVHGKRNCWECHADADVVPHKKGLERVQCVRCHYVGNTVGAPQSRRYKQYQESVHGRLAASGDGRAPLCQDCHGTHEVRPADDPTSRVHKRNIPDDCGRCHAKSKVEYGEGLHGQQAALGNPDAPVCTDCHSEHQILRPTDPDSKVYSTHIPEACGRCHEDQQVMDRYGLNAKNVATFKSSFHGVALKFGVTKVANCTSCHEHHRILPPQDPNSTVSPQRVPETCGQAACHPGASANFARGKMHVSSHEPSAGSIYWVARIFMILTVSVMCGLIFHISLDLLRRWLNRRRGIKTVHHHVHAGGRMAEILATPVLRLDLFVRIQHANMAMACILLIITGMPVKFHESQWAISMMSVVGGLSVTSVIHRIAATQLILVSLTHLFYIIATRPGRYNFWHMLPGPSDLEDVFYNFQYFLGFRRERPRFPRFSYLEKFDYWAVYWGCVVMILSGAVLWFETDAMRFIPKEFVDVAKEMHSDEGMLATLAIVIWHMFNAHLNPDKFPMNKVFYTGWTNIGELLEEHPKELVNLLKKGKVKRELIEEISDREPTAAVVLVEAFGAEEAARRVTGEGK